MLQKKGRTSLQVMELQYLSIEINPPFRENKRGEHLFACYEVTYLIAI